jgi:Flp pilus assembly pilin Flp
MNLTNAQRRQRAANVRLGAFVAIAIGILAALIAVFVLFVELNLIGASSTMFTNCGTALEPFAYPPGSLEAVACGGQLGAQATLAAALGLGAVVAGAIGTFVLVRTPAPMGF